MRSHRKVTSRISGGAPFLRRVRTLPEKIIQGEFPFTIPVFSEGIDVTFRTNVTFFIGENGSGKSTLLEAIAECCEFPLQGGNRVHRTSFLERSALAQAIRLSWQPKVSEGFFMRAESFYNFASYIDEVSDLRAYGGKSLHEQSHGESFLSLFAHRFEQGLYILDEPEAALSPQRQLSFLKIIHELERPGHAQFLIASHSPIVPSYPGAVIYSLDDNSIHEIDYRDSDHYLVTRDFLTSPERYFRHLFGGPGNDDIHDGQGI